MAIENIPPVRNTQHLRPQKEWKEIIAIYLYLAGMGAGSFAIGTLINWFINPSKTVYLWGFPFDLAKAALLWGPILVAIGAPFLILDLGIKKRFLYACLNPRTSWVARGFIILSIFIVIGLALIAKSVLPFEFHAVSAQSMVLAAIEPFRIAAKDQGVAIEVELTEDLPQVWADKSRISHVFDNLLTNGLKHTPAGGKITVSAKPEDNGVRFSVADTGKGIPSQYLPRIVEQFFRVPDQSSESGAWLGLAIVKEIVEAHGGMVSVDSSEGKGSTFSFTLNRQIRPQKERVHHDGPYLHSGLCRLFRAVPFIRPWVCEALQSD